MGALNIPNPYTTPKPWDTLEFANLEESFIWPPDADDATQQYGMVEWAPIKASAKIDKKSKSGAAKPKVSKAGGESISFSFVLVIVQTDEAIEAAAPILDQLRPGYGVYSLTRHPWATITGITGFLVESVEYAPPADGVLRVSVSCVEVNQDAQNGKGGSVVSTPGETQYEQRWRAEVAYQQNIARNLQAANQERRIIEQAAEAKAAFDKTGVRTARKISSVLAGEGEIDINNVQPQQPNPAAVAEGKI